MKLEGERCAEGLARRRKARTWSVPRDVMYAAALSGAVPNAPALAQIGSTPATSAGPAVQTNLGNHIEYTLDNAGNRTAETVKDTSGALRRQLARSIDALGRVQQTTGTE